MASSIFVGIALFFGAVIVGEALFRTMDDTGRAFANLGQFLYYATLVLLAGVIVIAGGMTGAFAAIVLALAWWMGRTRGQDVKRTDWGEILRPW